MKHLLIWTFSVLLAFPAFATDNKTNSELALIPVQAPAEILDDGDFGLLKKAAEQSIKYYQGFPKEYKFSFGSTDYTAKHLMESLRALVQLIEKTPSRPELLKALSQEFLWYRSIGGSDGKGTVRFSAYYEHTMPASLKKTEEYRYPLYGRPSDLVDVDLGDFNSKWKGERVSGRLVDGQLVPYFTREQIDTDKALAGQGLEIAWAKDPMDIWLLQVEGSGWLQLPDKSLARIRYGGNNGRPYKSVGSVLVENGIVPKDKINRQVLIDYLKKHKDAKQWLLNRNERYVFFRLERGTESFGPSGSLGVPLTAERSIATDPALFPRGALAYFETQEPVFDDHGDLRGYAPFGRFVLNQDEGGAIKGPARVDYFVGPTPEAEHFAVNFWQNGTLYFLVKKLKPSQGKEK